LHGQLTAQRETGSERAPSAHAAEQQHRQKASGEQHRWRSNPVHETEPAINSLERRLDLVHVTATVQSQSVAAPDQRLPATAEPV
jgi:hypothetical protein